MARVQHTEDTPLTQPSQILMPDSGPLVREPEQIAVVEHAQINKDYADALAFNEDVLEILLEPSSEENAPMTVDVYNNGQAVWVPVGQPFKIKRKFVEDLMRSRPVSIQTSHEDIGAKVINNRIIRNTRAKYPLSILSDPSPKGPEWMRRIRAEV